MNIRNSWELRASRFGNTPQAVMEQSFPSVINKYIGDIHIREISSHVPRGTSFALDIGCGWGRIARELAKLHPNLMIRGIDGSRAFVSAFNTTLGKRGKAVVGDMRTLPFGDNTFDLVYCVVSLMYLEKTRDQKTALAEIFRVLKPTGTFVLIEPNRVGVAIVRLCGLVPFAYRILLRRPKTETFGTSFFHHSLRLLIKQAGGEIVGARGYPSLTLSLLFLIMLGKIRPNLTKNLLRIVGAIDEQIRLPQFSYFTVWTIRRR